MNLENLNTEFLGKKIYYFPEMESTQIYAKSLNESDSPNGTVVITDSQTNGIGTHERKWYSGKNDNIAMTIILYPNCNIKKFLNLTVIIANTLIKTIFDLYGYYLEIKSPNDIIYNSKKIGGILTECITEGEMVKKFYIGIGFNVNQKDFPKELENIASSLKIEFGKELKREDIILRFFEIFEKEYLKLIKD